MSIRSFGPHHHLVKWCLATIRCLSFLTMEKAAVDECGNGRELEGG